MEQFLFEGLKQYGLGGILLAYFLYKDSRVFEMYRNSMKEIVDELKEMRREQDSLNADIKQIKAEIQRRN